MFKLNSIQQHFLNDIVNDSYELFKIESENSILFLLNFRDGISKY